MTAAAWKDLALRAIDCLRDVERETEWGQPTFGPTVWEGFLDEQNDLLHAERTGEIHGSDCSNAGYDQVPSRAIYERGGWFDGRLGQAYELLDAVRREYATATAELRLDLQKACDLTEENDAFMQQLANSGELA